MLNNKKRKNKGITLIALVITIIILLILAGISIAMLTGDNGILNKATIAKEENSKASAEEKVKIAVYGSYNTSGKIDKNELKKNLNNIEGIDKTTTDIKKLPAIVVCDGYEVEITGKLEVAMAKPGEIVTGTNREYEKNGTAVIPSGFAIVPGLDDVSEGLVISDVENDINDEGNQFVWIPVSDINKFIKIAGYRSGSLQNVSNFIEPYNDGDASEKKEYEDMKKSVEENQGFYIGRYEVGKDEDEKTAVKKNQTAYINIKWGNSMTDSAGGAVEVARNFTQEKKYTSVKSTLIFGVQWDATMQFMDNNYISGNCDETSYVYNSTGKGSYNGLIETGSDEKYKVKNIYDMAGNAWEWTMEASGSNLRVLRGGLYYNSNGHADSVSSRYESIPNEPSYGASGIRITLFVLS